MTKRVEVIFDGGGINVECECGKKLTLDTTDQDVLIDCGKAWEFHHGDEAGAFLGGEWHRPVYRTSASTQKGEQG